MEEAEMKFNLFTEGEKISVDITNTLSRSLSGEDIAEKVVERIASEIWWQKRDEILAAIDWKELTPIIQTKVMQDIASKIGRSL